MTRFRIETRLKLRTCAPADLIGSPALFISGPAAHPRQIRRYCSTGISDGDLGMAWSTPRACATINCGGTTRRTYCDACNKARKRRIDRRRKPVDRRFYKTKAWRIIRRRILARDYYCVTPGCRNVSTVVHHIVDRALGGSDDDGNLEGRCKPCHDSITAKTRAFGRGASNR